VSGAFWSFAFGFALSIGLVPLCRIVANRTGLVAHPRNDRWHRASVPMLGGVAIALSMLIVEVVTGNALDLAVPLSAALFISAAGLADDILNLKPATKLLAQIMVAAWLVYFGYRLNWIESRLFDSVLTMVWVVGLTNAFNLLDNMDGLCAGTALVVAVMLGAGLIEGAGPLRAGPELSWLGALAGGIAGFLVYNFPPASIFMGDSGSLLLGFSLAALTLSDEGVRGSRSDVLSVIAGPVFVLLLPIFDTTLVTISRLLSGRSPALGGRDHSSHRLVAIGLSERTAVYVLWFLATVGGAVGLILRNARPEWSLLAGSLFLLLMCLFAVYLARVRVYEDPSALNTGNADVTVLPGEVLYKRRVAEVLLDFCLISIAYYAANRLRFGPEAYLDNAERFYSSLPMLLAVQLASFFFVGVYRGTWHYFGLMDGVNVAKGVVFGTAAAQLATLYIYRDPFYSRAVFLIYAVLLAVLVTASRASWRLMGEFVLRQGRASRRALVYGSVEHAQVAISELQQRRDETFKIIGLIDDNPAMAKMRLQGYPVLGNFDAFATVVSDHQVDTIILNRKPLDAARLEAIEALCRERGLSLLRLEISLKELVAGDGPVAAPRLLE
jgi:UDP-GlcNAc:undecaprenyl-phosphate GlcNAc-1-phosphate transferase